MALHPEVAAYRASRAAAGTPPLYAQTLPEARAADLAAIRAGGGAVEPVAEVRDERIPGPAGELPVRVYRPAGRPHGTWSVRGAAGHEGLEPPTFGFGDRCSAS